MRNSKVIYTCITGGYDKLAQPSVLDPSFDYVCFSDDIPQEKAGIWQIRPIPIKGLTNVRRARYVKLSPHKTVPEYEYSVWIDASIMILDSSFYDRINSLIAKGVILGNVPHPERECTYDEIWKCLCWQRTGLRDALRVNHHLRKEGFPEHLGMYETGLILRRHNDPKIIAVDEDWWQELNNYSHRDQLSYVYVLWKNDIKPELIFGENHNLRNADCVKCIEHVVPVTKTFANKSVNHIARLIYKLFSR